MWTWTACNPAHSPIRLMWRLIASGVKGPLLGREWRVADVALIEMPADDGGPRCINRYSVEVERFDAISGHKFKIDPARLVYSLQWRPNSEQASLQLVLVQDEPAGWVNTANLTLLSVLRQQTPDAINWGPLLAAGVGDMLDAFDAAREATRQHPTRRH